jgi:hypothetical protein
MSTITGESSGINKTSSFNTFRTYSYINNSMFYPLVPKEYYDYYNRFIRQYFYWYDGFQPEFHTQNSGIFSTRIAYTLCNKLSGLINGGTLMFDSPEKLSEYKLSYNAKDKKQSNALEFIERWSYDVDLTNKNDTAIQFALAGGDSVFKLNSNGEDLYPTVLRKDNYFVDSDFRGDITHFTGLIYAYTVMNKPEGESAISTTDYYYLLEERRYNELGEPEFRLFVKVGTGNMTNMRDIDFQKIQEIPYEKLPREVKRALKRNYPENRLGEWSELPLPSLGIYLMKNTDTVSFMPQVPMGESILSNLVSYLMSYDYYFSAFNTDLYLGRGRVLLPEPMQNPHKTETGGYYDGLDSGVYNFAKYVDPESQKPQLIQFDIRGSDWDTVSKMILRLIAMSIGVSDRTISNFLTDGSERATAREISVDDSTATFVENKRTLFRKPLNKMLQDVLDFYEFPDEIIVRFSRVGLNNMNEISQQMATLRQNDLIDIRSAIEYIFVDKNEAQLDEMYELIKEQMKEQQEAKEKSTSDEGYEQENNNDISHVESE